MKKTSSPALLILLPLALTACSSGGSTGSPKLYCPQVAVLQQGQNLTSFLPGRTDVAAEITHAQITGVAGSCALIKDKKVALVTFEAGFLASNGPANQGKPLSLPYFVAITQGNKIVDKSSYTIGLSFNGNFTTATATSKPVKVELPNDPANTSLQVLVSFQLTPEEQSYAQSHPAQ